MEGRDEVRRAIEVGARLGLILEQRLAEALHRLQTHAAGPLSAEELTSWIGRSAAEVEGLLALVPHEPVDTPTEHLRETVRSRGDAVTALAPALGGARATPPTVTLTDPDLPTARLGTPAADTPAVAPGPAEPRANIPRRLGPYLLGVELWHGGMAIVFSARHEKLGSAC